MKVLIDGDVLRYEIGSIELENPYCFNGKMPAPPEMVETITKDRILEIVEDTNADSYEVILSGSNNFRNSIAIQQPYKGNREGFVRPYNWRVVDEYLQKNHPCQIVEGYEADDWLGIEQRKNLEGTCIASRDKDMKTVMGYHYRWACGKKQPKVPIHWIDEFDSRLFFFKQMLTGDNTDNILGCGKKVEALRNGVISYRRKGIGEKTADTLLSLCNTVQELYDTVRLQYEMLFGEDYESIFLENARLLYIGQTHENLFEWDWLDYSVTKGNDNVSILGDEQTNKQACNSGIEQSISDGAF